MASSSASLFNPLKTFIFVKEPSFSIIKEVITLPCAPFTLRRFLHIYSFSAFSPPGKLGVPSTIPKDTAV